MEQSNKLVRLLKVVVESYISKGEPVGSKFLHSLDDVTYAPSTLRKHLNLLEREGLVFQSYNSSGRIPTITGLSKYIEELIESEISSNEDYNLEIQDSRMSLKYMVEQLGSIVDGVTVGFIEHDEYFYLGVNKLLKEEISSDEYAITKKIIKIIEDKQIIWFLSSKILKNNQIYYTFIGEEQQFISCLFTRITINDFPAIISIIWGIRVDYERNCNILKTVLSKLSTQ